MQQQIDVKEKNMYGNLLVYPVCDKAKLFARLTQTKTLTQAHLEVIRHLGFSIRFNDGTGRILEALSCQQ